MKILGLDEAGRGSVLGPLVVGGFLVDEADLDALRATGVDDSKKLSKKKREAILPKLGGVGVGQIVSITPAQIDAGNINTLEERAFVELIRTHRPDHVIIDAPCHPRGIPAFCRRLLAQLDYAPGLTVEPKADANYAPCGAASIYAKVNRDAAIKALGPEVGSGYPSDPKTRAWIKGYLDRGEALPACVRTRWGTIAELSQQSLFSGRA